MYYCIRKLLKNCVLEIINENTNKQKVKKFNPKNN